MSDSKIRNKAKRRILFESLMVFFIVLSPFVFKAHVYFPISATFEIKFLGLEIGSNGFNDVNTFIWFLIGKIVPLYLLIFWFFSCKHWWYHAILIPITMYAFQLFEVLYMDSKFIDTANMLWLLPVCMVVVPTVYFIRIKLYDKYVHGIDLEAIEAELQELKSKPELQTDMDAHSLPEEVQEPKTLSEKINQRLSTGNMENLLRHWQHRVENWLHFKF